MLDIVYVPVCELLLFKLLDFMISFIISELQSACY